VEKQLDSTLWQPEAQYGVFTSVTISMRLLLAAVSFAEYLGGFESTPEPPMQQICDGKFWDTITPFMHA
jgi:hypothetical protein